jgi:hypothetical protein
MKPKTGKTLLTAVFLLGILAIVAVSLRAYVPLRWVPNGVRAAWAPMRFPLAFYLNQATAKGTPNLAAGSNAPAAVRAAMTAWQSVQTAEIHFADLRLTPVDSARDDDGMNLITGADTAINREILGGDNGAIALTRLIFNANTGEITESDIILNPAYRFSTNLAFGTYDLQSIVTHELGHALGCDHATAQNDTMFPATAPGEFFQRYLSADAITFAGLTYPNPARVGSMGTISGRITSGGMGIFGASITAMNLDHNLIYTTLSEPNGSYTINGPPAGRYAIYAEPLDGPATPDQLVMQGTGAYYSGLNTTFRTVFAGEQWLGTEGAPRTVIVNFDSRGLATLNIDRMGRGDPSNGFGYLSAGAVVVTPGELLSLWIGGRDTWKVAGVGDVQILGSGLALNPSRGVKILKNISGVEVGISVLLQVAADAAPGARTVVLKVGDQQVASTGGIVVVPRTIPSTTLYYPYLKASPDRYTGIALANPVAGTPATVRISARSNEGEMLWSEDALIPSDWTLPGGFQSAQLERQIFNLPFEATYSGSMTVESDSPDLRGFFLTGDFANTFLDGAEAFTRGYRQIYFVDILQNQVTSTEIHLMNVKDLPATVDLFLADENGNTIRGPVKRTIPGAGKIGESVVTLFGYAGELRSAHVKAIATDDTLAGFELISHGAGGQPDAVFGLNALPMENTGSVLYSPQMAVGDLGVHYETRLNVVNAGDSAAPVLVELLDEYGGPITPGAMTENLAPGAHVTLDIGSFFGITLVQGYIRVSTPGNGKLLGNVLFGDGDPAVGRLNFGAALPLFASGATQFLFAHVAQNLGYYTGLAFLAPEGANQVKVEAFAGDGTPRGNPAIFPLARGQRLAGLLKGLIPETDGQMGGYVKVTADQPLIGFELFGSSDGRMLSAVPPQRLLK